MPIKNLLIILDLNLVPTKNRTYVTNNNHW